MLAVAVALAVVVASPAAVGAQPRTAAQVIAEVQKTYAGVTDMRAAFEQKVTNVTFGRTSVVGGQLLIKRPRKLRFDYHTKPTRTRPAVKTAKSFISDGASLWMVDLENQQIVTSSLADSPLPIAVAFLSGSTTWAADFRAKLDASGTYGASGDHVVLLTPKTPSTQYKKLYLVVDPTTMQVRESIVIDVVDNISHFTFMSADLAATSRDSMFVVDPSSPMFASFRLITPPAPAPAPRRARPRRP
jgi:outer membrane lipoprotein-sorting protein